MAARFNVRVYGIWLQDGQILVNEELIKGRTVIKLPGGGLELGEGTIDGLKREWKEELDIDIEVTDHFYTTDFFQQSAFDDTQVISIYYFVTAAPGKLIKNLVPGELTYWLPLKSLNRETFTLPIDRVVGNMLLRLFT
jgi:8-oxo-dGTP diphosphatase